MSVMKWWSKYYSMVIAKTASRNVAFKSDKLIDALFQDQYVAQTRLSTLTSKAWPATRSCIFLIRMMARSSKFWLISVMSWLIHKYYLNNLLTNKHNNE